MEVVRLKPYVRAMEGMGLSQTEMAHVEAAIVASPEAHPVIKGLRGARKARFGLPGRGKSGGGRTIYYVAVAPRLLVMMTAYPKSERDNLSSEQRRAVLSYLESMKRLDR